VGFSIGPRVTAYTGHYSKRTAGLATRQLGIYKTVDTGQLFGGQHDICRSTAEITTQELRLSFIHRDKSDRDEVRVLKSAESMAVHRDPRVCVSQEFLRCHNLNADRAKLLIAAI
jgi:hypothetical protein